MNIANEIALLTCKQHAKLDDETDVEYSTRLYEVFSVSQKAIQSLIDQEEQEAIRVSNKITSDISTFVF